MLSRLVPLVVMGGIAAHSNGAIQERLKAALAARDTVVTKQRMLAIGEAILLRTVAEEPVEIDTQKHFEAFIRKAVRLRGGAAAGDPSKDFWGTPFQVRRVSGGVALYSAGADKRFGTKDDLTHTQLFDY
jgi:hypothetical protein